MSSGLEDGTRFPMLRQQQAKENTNPQRSLADFIAPKSTGLADYLGAFAVSAGFGADELADRLSRIDHLEALLVPARSAFGFLLSRNSGRVDAIAAELAGTWKDSFAKLDLDALGALEKEIAESYGDAATGRRWTELGRALKDSDYGSLLHLLLEQNAFVMRSRNGSDPWARVVRGKLDVRFRDESSGLVPRGELASAWRSNFFLNPLQSMVHSLRGSR